MRRGSLTVVGTGIQVGTQTTLEATAAIEEAEEVLYLVTDPVAEGWIAKLNPRARSLDDLYRADGRRADSYRRIVDAIASSVRAGVDVCVVFYGHPGVFVRPAHDAIRLLRDEGFRATMLPGVSAEDCLFADLGVDPGQGGCHTYEATDFLVHRRAADPTASLILWQLSVLGSLDVATEAQRSALPFLLEHLLRFYAADHEVVLYEASPYPVVSPIVERIQLSQLPVAAIAAMTTLYVPPAARPERDEELAHRLGLPRP
jgi:uncharacterized protein YabN with tetrapyrrole methylase and pyrophosphatase domain